ncbi:hypothetical protein KY327_01905 [Candidatus Woesearchaeota archaeon]|nr:hypothetical protein [Candidatus Woesearchaeota archaeon]
MVASYLGGILEIANVFISLFVLIYAWSFLKQTQDVRDRKPWVFLFIAAVVFFAFEVVGVLDIFALSQIPGLRNFLESAFIALILFVFIFQYDLILKSDLILITRKMAKEGDEEEKVIEEKLGTDDKPKTRKKASKKTKKSSRKKKTSKKKTGRRKKQS